MMQMRYGLFVVGMVGVALAEHAAVPVSAVAQAQAQAQAQAVEVRDACTLLPKEELTKALKAQVADVEKAATETESTCKYLPPTGDQQPPITLTITWTGGKAALARVKRPGSKAVAGEIADAHLGDASFFSAKDEAIYVVKGDVLIAIEFGSVEGTQDDKRSLARTVLGNL